MDTDTLDYLSWYDNAINSTINGFNDDSSLKNK